MSMAHKAHALAPIILFTYNRPEHTQQVLDCLAKNHLASRSELYIFCDGPKNERAIAKNNATREIITREQTLGRFGTVHVRISEKNRGLANSIISGVTEIIGKYKRCIAITFLWVNFCWIFFRAGSLHNALEVIKGLFQGNNGISQPYTWTFFAIAVLIVEFVLVCNRKKQAANEVFSNYWLFDLHRVLPLAMFLVFVGITIIMAYVGDTSFIYGKF